MSLTTTCANKTAPACVVYGPGNETDLSLDSRGGLYVDAPVTSIESLPPSATALTISSSTLVSINPTLGSTLGAASQLASISLRFNLLGESLNAVQWPQSLVKLDLTGNKLHQINASFSIPAKLRTLALSSNQITSIDGLVIPSSLQSLSLYVNTIDTFNINAASFAALSRVQLFTDRAIRALECKGTRQTFQGAIDAEVNGGRPLLHTACVLDVGAAATTVPVGPGTADASSTDSGASTGLYAGLGIGAAVLILLVIGGLLRLRHRRRSNTQYLDHSTPSAEISRKPNAATASYDETPVVVSDFAFAYSYDIRSDPELNGYRIPKRELAQKQICGNGGFAIVYRALFQDQVVAVKELQAVHTRHATHVQAFMHEIQLFSTLHHDNIPMSAVQMALLVSTGKLTPTFRDDCPSDILALAKACLAMDPDDRPTAAHVAYALRKLIRATE
ncbi:hypothetical protein SDRG_15835 [Saprolegnia diclina VS20]|uniref:Protein kinase domain-containing protein n=1 Tax=Saprolegnia diclina (strain VS20) TaxID=1156394 RepID=T0R2U4_SAPDV|nr:hypothetical protein SDRG_15835 [Saprolegnia diclina VS20]EQC26348.1 hypothetical protein SDRG_15835 [Saprolegnia diclina VS20]|eukprot:XP_008620241.1 hypothetical protein SDRG_15835 [Saprolegnia diclina VS20]